MAFKIFRRIADMLDLDETSKTAGNVIAVNATEDGYELVSPTAGGGAPADATYIVQTANASLSAEQALGSLATGIVKNTTTTGVLSIASEGTDYYKPSGTDVAVADGGTGASTASGARTNLGLVIGTDVASQASLDAHLNDTADAHDASAISILDTANDFTATDVEGALAELQSDAEADATALSDHLADTTAAHAASAISADSTTLVGTGTDVQAVLEELDNGIADHLADTTDAHDASAISVLDTAANFTGTDVEAVLAELQDNIGAGGGGSFDPDIHLPWRIEIHPWSIRSSQSGTWSIESFALNDRLYQGDLNNGGNNTDYLEWPIILSAGTWSFQILGVKYTNGAITTVSIDGTSVGTFDQYAGSALLDQIQTITGITVATSGKKLFRLATATKNASSSSFVGRYQNISLVRTA